jgi:hypothetical protein
VPKSQNPYQFMAEKLTRRGTNESIVGSVVNITQNRPVNPKQTQDITDQFSLNEQGKAIYFEGEPPRPTKSSAIF